MHNLFTSTEIDVFVANCCKIYMSAAILKNCHPVVIVDGDTVVTGYATPSVVQYIKTKAEYLAEF